MTEKDNIGMECSQFESMLADALDGTLTEGDNRAFESHAGTCPTCGPMFLEARQGMLWLGRLEDLEPPKNLVHNILAATTLAEATQEEAKAKTAQPGRIARMWKPVKGVLKGMIQPRFATSFSMAFFSLSLTLTLAGVRFKDLAQINWHPSALGKAIVMEYTQVESKVVRFYRNMRLVYEIESRVQEMKKNSSSDQNDQQKAPAEQPKDNKKKNNDTSGHPEERQERYSRELENAVISCLKTSNKGA